MKKTRILFSFHNSDYYSGATRSLLDIIDGLLLDDKYCIYALFPSRNGTAVDYLAEKNILILESGFFPLIDSVNDSILKRVAKIPVHIFHMLRTVACIKKLKSFFSTEKIDAVYCNTSINYTGALIQKYYKINNIWHFREYRIEDHGILIFGGEKHLKKIANKYSKYLIFISKSMYDYHKSIGYDSSKMIMAYNDVSPKYIVKRDWDKYNEVLNILIAGDVKEGKGQLDVIKALKLCRERGHNFRLFIAGQFKTSEYTNSILEYISQNNLENFVKVLGLVQDMNSLRATCDIGVVASRKEALGRVTIEGMLAGLSMIGSKTGGTIELIENGVNGLLYEVGNVEELASRLIYLDSNRNAMIEMAKQGYNFSISQFASGNCKSTVARLLDEV